MIYMKDKAFLKINPFKKGFAFFNASNNYSTFFTMRWEESVLNEIEQWHELKIYASKAAE